MVFGSARMASQRPRVSCGCSEQYSPMSLHPASKENESKASASLGKDKILEIALLGDCLTNEANSSREIRPFTE